MDWVWMGCSAAQRSREWSWRRLSGALESYGDIWNAIEALLCPQNTIGFTVTATSEYGPKAIDCVMIKDFAPWLI